MVYLPILIKMIVILKQEYLLTGIDLALPILDSRLYDATAIRKRYN